MKLKPKHNILDILELDIPALIETKEGKLLGGFCTIPVAGFGRTRQTLWSRPCRC